ncbi:XRE family transcriptional regulator [Aeromicrobium sp. Root495]|uniref:helix-turn-helix domain-containing protein n=1 Tax=Aeromicrobium sp. Root495 TaxID=1736550 RepID=UPI0006FB891A|nr:XRE family transcriptional regulator [Aeromicrobium sp. Root495]
MPPSSPKPPVSAATGEFGHRVRTRRHELGLSQEKLAERSQLHWSYIGQVERGQTNLTLHNIVLVALALEIDPGQLVEGITSLG